MYIYNLNTVYTPCLHGGENYFYAKNFDSYFVDRMALILVEIFIPDWLKIFTYDLNQPIGPLPFC